MALGEETWRREASWTNTYKDLKSFHDNAYRKIDEALLFDEEGQHSNALSSYEEGLSLLDKALSINIECPSNPDFTWEKACSMIEKMRKTRKEILLRISSTQVPRPSTIQLTEEPPPSYDEAMATSPTSPSASDMPSLPQCSRMNSTNSAPMTYSELGDALRNLKVETAMQSVQIVFQVDGVRIYFISPDGTVSAMSEPGQLRILQLEDGQESGLPRFFLQVGDWFYPLVPNVSPCFRSDYGAFILPDLQSNIEGAAVGLILPPESDISLYNFLEDVLHSVVPTPPKPVTRSRTPQSDNFSTTISKGIVTGAQYVSTGLIKGAECASQYISTTTPKIISRLQPEENPRPVPSSVRTGAKVARSVTHKAVNVTGYVGDQLDKPGDRLTQHLSKLTKDFNRKLTLIEAKARHKERKDHRREEKLRYKEEKAKQREERAKEREESENSETGSEEQVKASSSHSHRHPRFRLGRGRPRTSHGVKQSGKVGSATMALGRYLAPHIQKGGTKLLSKAGVTEEKAEEGVGGALTVAAGAVEGFSTIYTGLEQSAGILGTSLANNTVQIVHHKYGEPMAEVAGDTLFTVGNVINTTNNLQNLTPKGLAKRTAKDAGKAIVEPHKPSQKGPDHNGPSTSSDSKK